MAASDPVLEEPRASRTLDFDTFLAEREAEPVIFVFKGKSYDLGSELPAMVALDVIRQRAIHGDAGDIPPEKLEELLRGILGEHFEPIIVEGRMGLNAMAAMLVEVFKLFNPPANRGERRAKRKAKRPARRRST
jgi:hypothetical protein